MKAFVAVSKNKLRYTEWPIPKYSDNEILVRIISACICNGSDPAILSGHTWDEFPVVFGHEPFGVIEKVGKNVKDFAAGDLVSWWFSMGAFAEYAVVDPNKVAVLRLPDNMDYKTGPLFEIFIAASRAVSKVDICGKNVLIMGLGPSGLIMSQLAKIKGAKSVTGFDLYRNRLDLGLKLGCDAAFDILDGLESNRYDLIFDAYGNDILPNEPALDKAVLAATDCARIISYGHPVNGRRLNPYLIQKKNITIVTPENRIEKIRESADECLGCYLKGNIDLLSLVTAETTLDKTAEWLEILQAQPDRHIKIIVKI